MMPVKSKVVRGTSVAVAVLVDSGVAEGVNVAVLVSCSVRDDVAVGVFSDVGWIVGDGSW
jgi:hypothetical protein